MIRKSFLLILLATQTALATPGHYGTCELLFADGVQLPALSLDLRGKTSKEVLAIIPDVDWENPTRTREIVEKVSRGLGVSKSELDEWLKVIVDAGLFGGPIQMDALYFSHGRNNSGVAYRKTPSGYAFTYTKASSKQLFAPYLTAGPEQKALLDAKAIAMVNKALVWDHDSKKSPFIADVLGTFDWAAFNKLNEDPLKNDARFRSVLATLYRATLVETMKQAINTAPSSTRNLLFNSDRVFFYSLFGPGFIGASGTLFSGFDLLTSVMTGLPYVNALHTTEGFAGLLAVAFAQSSGVDRLKAWRRKRNDSVVKSLPGRLSGAVAGVQGHFQVEELDRLKLGEPFETITIPLRAQLQREEIYAEMTLLESPADYQVAVDRAMPIAKLSYDTLEVQTRRLRELKQRVSDLTAFLAGKTNVNPVAGAKLESILANVRSHILGLTSDVEFTLDVLKKTTEFLGRAERDARLAGPEYAQFRDDISYFKTDFQTKYDSYASSSKTLIESTRTTMTTLQKAYLSSANSLD